MTDQCSLLNDLRGGDHHKRTTVLAGVSHDERCLEAADEIERLRNSLSYLLRHTTGADLRSMGFRMDDTSSVDEFMALVAQMEDLE